MKQLVGVETLSPKSTAALAIAGTLAWLPMNLLPYEITTLADDFKLGMRGASLAATVQLLVLASTATWLGRTIDRRDKRRLTILGISIGIAALRGKDDNAVGLLKRADQALYRAKRDGRNRVVPDAA